MRVLALQDEVFTTPDLPCEPSQRKPSSTFLKIRPSRAAACHGARFESHDQDQANIFRPIEVFFRAFPSLPWTMNLFLPRRYRSPYRSCSTPTEGRSGGSFRPSRPSRSYRVFAIYRRRAHRLRIGSIDCTRGGRAIYGVLCNLWDGYWSIASATRPQFLQRTKDHGQRT